MYENQDYILVTLKSLTKCTRSKRGCVQLSKLANSYCSKIGSKQTKKSDWI